MCDCTVRFATLILGTLCLTSVISNILIWNFTKLCMLEEIEETFARVNFSSSESFSPVSPPTSTPLNISSTKVTTQFPSTTTFDTTTGAENFPTTVESFSTTAEILATTVEQFSTVSPENTTIDTATASVQDTGTANTSSTEEYETTRINDISSFFDEDSADYTSSGDTALPSEESRFTTIAVQSTTYEDQATTTSSDSVTITPDSIPGNNSRRKREALTLDSSELSTELFQDDVTSAPVQFPHRFTWSLPVQDLIFSSFAWGAVAAVFPCMWATQRFGARIVFTIVGLLSAASTLLSPLAAYHGYEYFIACRVVQGFGYSLVMPIIAAIVAHWAPLRENGIFMGVLSSVIQLSPVLAMPVAGYFCTNHFGWAAVYYTFGIFTLILTFLWSMFYQNNPRKHPWITGYELDRIYTGKGTLQKRNAQVIPWKQLLTSLPVWAILIATFGNMVGIQTVIFYMPTYLKHILNYDLFSSGFLAATPFLVQFGVKLFAGFASDCLPVGETCKIRIFNSLALCGMALFLAAVGFVPRSSPEVAVGFLILAPAILGFNAGGFFKSTTLMAREFSPIVMGFVQFITCVVLLSIPFVKGAVVTDEGDISQWRILFLIAVGLLVVCNAIFCFLCSGEAASWVSPGQKGEKKTKPDEDEISIEAGILEMRVVRKSLN